jgi:hypothetical protein
MIPGCQNRPRPYYPWGKGVTVARGLWGARKVPLNVVNQNSNNKVTVSLIESKKQTNNFKTALSTQRPGVARDSLFFSVTILFIKLNLSKSSIYSLH